MNEIRFIVSSKLLQLRITEAHRKGAEEFRFENDSLLFIKDDVVVVELGIINKGGTAEGLVDWYKWIQLANIMKHVTEQPAVILFIETSDTTHRLEILHLTI